MPRKPDTPAAIRFEGVAYRLATGHSILRDLTFAVAPGETIVLLGRSGSGKTTTLKLINRLLEPSEGRVSVEGKPTSEWDPIRLRRRIGYVIQEVGLFPHFTIEENVGLAPWLEGWDEARARARVREMLDLVGLAPDRFAGRYPDQLSGGQRQRVGVARALAADPAFLLMDEPFGALDPITRTEVRREFQRLQARLKKTTVFVTHDVAEAFALADRIGLLVEGRLAALVAPDEFRSLDAPEAARFLECLA